MDKFAQHYNTPEKVDELAEYVHLNFKLILTKMTSEMRRKLEISPNLQNTDGYISLLVSLYAAMFQEMVLASAGFCQSFDIKAEAIIQKTTLKILLNLLEGKNLLEGRPRTDIKDDLEGFKKYYLQTINELRENTDCLPKD